MMKNEQPHFLAWEMQSKHFGIKSKQCQSSSFLFTGTQHDFTQIIKNKIDFQ